MQDEPKNPIKMSRRKIQRDPHIQRLIERAEQVKISDKLDEEIKQYFITSRDLASGKFSHRGISARFDNPMKNMEKIASVILDIQAYKDRLIHIQCLLFEHASALTSCKRVAIEHIRESYSEILKARGSLALQEVFIDSVIEPILEKRELVDLYLKKVNVILENLHNSHFAYRDVGEFGKTLITRIEGGRHTNVRI